METILLRYPRIVAGEGPYASVAEAMGRAARDVDNVYRRYGEQVARWLAPGREPAPR